MKPTIAAALITAALVPLSLTCSSHLKQKFLDEPYRDKEVAAPLVITGIEVADARGPVGSVGVAIPSFTFKNVGDTFSPPLTAAQEMVIKEEIARCVKNGNIEARVRITVKEGTKQFSMGFFRAREYAKTAVTVDLFDDVSSPHLFSTSGEAYYEVKSTKADTLFLETLYRKAFKTCITKAFESVEKFLEERSGK